jgi:hypothetical protein
VSNGAIALFERTSSLDIDETYLAVKSVLADKKCKVMSETPPKEILVKQGSLWGTSPKTAKKTLKVNLVSVGSGTKMVCSSRLSSDWINITLIGCVFAAVLIGFCLWMALDLSSFMATHKPSFWSWLVTVNGNIDFQMGQAFENLTKALAAFLSLVIVLEIAIVAYVHARIDRFAEETLNSISP